MGSGVGDMSTKCKSLLCMLVLTGLGVGAYEEGR